MKYIKYSSTQCRHIRDSVKLVLGYTLIFLLSISCARAAAFSPAAEASNGLPAFSQTVGLFDASVSTEQGLRDAVANVPVGNPTTITLTANINLTNDTLEIPASTLITFAGNYRLNGASGFATITVRGNLTLAGITVSHVSGQTGVGINVLSGGTLTLQSGTISGNTVTGRGAGVLNAGMFNMNGGTISGNTATYSTSYDGGGGVYNNGTFNLSGGTISGNRANGTSASGGGLYNTSGRTVNMTGGTIGSGNTAGGYGTGVCNRGTFNMSGGQVSGQTTSQSGAGVYNYGGNFYMSGTALITNNTVTGSSNGGGFYNTGRFEMSGGTISNNKSPYNGSGVRNVNGATFIMSGTALITGNTGGAGGGVCNEGTFTMTGGTISNNSNSSSGGGLYVNNTGITTMTGGTISGNRSGQGGGVYVWSGTFNMTGGTVTDNTATGLGGGIYHSAVQNFTVSNAAITNNSAGNFGGGIYLAIYGGTTTISDSEITGNTSDTDGGGVFINPDYLDKLVVSNTVLFSDNTASRAYPFALTSPDAEIYAANIGPDSWSDVPDWTAETIHGYNNFDIGYRWRAVTYDLNVISGSTTAAPFTPAPNSTYAPVRSDNTGGRIGEQGTTEYIDPGAPTRPYYTFEGWYEDPDAIGEAWDFASDTVLGPSTPVKTLYAKWTPHPVTVYFKNNYDSADTSDFLTVDSYYDEVLTEPTPVPARPGYTFAGWHKDREGSNAWDFASDTLTVANGVSGNPLTLNLYAKWEQLTYQIVYVYLGSVPPGVPAPPSPDSAVYGEEVTLAEAPVDPGGEYTFSGWSSEQVTKITDGKFTMPDSDVMFTGSWIRRTVTVTFDGNGGNPAEATRTLSAGTSLGADMPPTPARSGYTFTGWNTEQNGGGTAFSSDTLVPQDVTVYAQWRYNPLPPTDPPTTEPPTTEIPPTEPPTTEIPPTDPPLTELPTPEPPTTEIPPTEPPTTELPPVQPPKTGDNSAASFWLITMAISLACVWIILRRERKNAAR